MWTKLVSVLFLFVITCVSGTTVGVYVTPSGIDQIKRRLTMNLNTMLKKKELPKEAPGSKVTKTVANIFIHDFYIKHENVFFAATKDGSISFGLQDINTHVEADYALTKFGMDFAGRADVNVEGAGVQLTIGLSYDKAKKNFEVILASPPKITPGELTIEAKNSSNQPNAKVGLTNFAMKFKDTVKNTVISEGVTNLQNIFKETIQPMVKKVPLNIHLEDQFGVKLINVDFSPIGNIDFSNNAIFFQTDLVTSTGKVDLKEYNKYVEIPPDLSPPSIKVHEHIILQISEKQFKPMMKPFFDGKQKPRVKIGYKMISDPKNSKSPSVQALMATAFVNEVEVYSMNLKDFEAQLSMLGVPSIELEIDNQPIINFSKGQIHAVSQVRMHAKFVQKVPEDPNKPNGKLNESTLTFQDEGFELTTSLQVSVSSDYDQNIQLTAHKGIYTEVQGTKSGTPGSRVEVKPAHSKLKIKAKATNCQLSYKNWVRGQPFGKANLDSFAYFANKVVTHFLQTMPEILIDFPTDQIPPMAFLKDMSLAVDTDGWMRVGLTLDYDFKDTIEQILNPPIEGVDLQGVGQKSPAKSKILIR